MYKLMFGTISPISLVFDIEVLHFRVKIKCFQIYLTRDYYYGYIYDRENVVREKYGEITLNPPLYPGHDNPE